MNYLTSLQSISCGWRNFKNSLLFFKSSYTLRKQIKFSTMSEWVRERDVFNRSNVMSVLGWEHDDDVLKLKQHAFPCTGTKILKILCFCIPISCCLCSTCSLRTSSLLAYISLIIFIIGETGTFVRGEYILES